MRQGIYIFLLSSIAFLNSGCFNTRFLSEDEQLFKANKINFVDEEPESNKGAFKNELKDISQLQPNKKFIGLAKTRLWFYNVANRRRENKFRYWMKNKVGEEPVLYDEVFARKSAVMMKNYLINKGYFYASVNIKKVDIGRKKKRAELHYLIDLDAQYKIDQISFPKGKTPVDSIVRSKSEETLLKKHEPFDVSVLKKERERIANNLKDRGYFAFSKEFVFFNLDSNDVTRKIDIETEIGAPGDSLKHELYYVRDIYVYTDYSSEQLLSEVKFDTVHIGHFHFIAEEHKYRHKVLINNIHQRYGDLYSRQKTRYTTNQLTELGVFKFVNVSYKRIEGGSKNMLDCMIHLSPSKRQAFSIDAEANNNTDFLLGVAASFNYTNKNIFRGTEQFNINVSGGLESNFDGGTAFFNTGELNIEGNLLFNKLVVPFRLNNAPYKNTPKTILSLRYSLLRRINFYTINSINLSYRYDWRAKKSRRNVLTPVVASLIRLSQTSQEFLEILAQSQTLRNSFTEQFILGSEYNFFYTNQQKTERKSYVFYRGGLDVAGNILHGVVSLVNKNKNVQKPYQIFNINYAQYVITVSEIRNYWDFHKHARLVTRAFAGVGVSYGNSSALPYTKQFASGGANGIRAWRVRTLGPGSFDIESSEVDQSNNFALDQTGDIKLESNIELRFDIIKFIKGALFLDAGNIWLLRSDESRPGGNFKFDRFVNEFALGTGIGARIDFSYFVLRFDVGMPLRDPAKVNSASGPWIIKDFNFGDSEWRKDNIKFNLAIGYPF